MNIKLRVRSWTNTVGALVVRGYTKEGVFNFPLTTNGTGAVQVTDFSIQDLPLAVSIIHTGTVFQQAECYVSLNLLLNDDIMQELCAGEVNVQRGISYPVTNQLGSFPHGGLLTSATGPNPAAGAQATYTAPTNQIYRLISAEVTFNTAVAVANRRVHLIGMEGASEVFRAYGDIDQAASLSYTYCFCSIPQAPAAVNNNFVIVPIPPNIIINSSTLIRTDTTNMQAADDFNPMFVYGERFMSPSS